MPLEFFDFFDDPTPYAADPRNSPTCPGVAALGQFVDFLICIEFFGTEALRPFKGRQRVVSPYSLQVGLAIGRRSTRLVENRGGFEEGMESNSRLVSAPG